MATNIWTPGNTLLRAGLSLPGPVRYGRLVVVLVLVALALAPGELGALTRSLMTDAYVQVSVFVAATLLLFYGSERVFKYDLGNALRRARHWQVPIAALLGATPGCGGAVIVVAAYSSGNAGFGAVVAALTATMGDAAFLLIATRPDAAAVVLPLSLAVGVISGWVVDRVIPNALPVLKGASCNIAPRIGRLRPRDIAYLLPVVPGLVAGVAQVAQAEIDTILGLPVNALALIGTALGLFIWATSPVTAMTNSHDAPLTRMAEETSFISVWVIGAYLAYDYVATFAGIDIGALFDGVTPLLPLIAIAIGFVPGCGPQVLVATLYLNGAIPFAALIGNAISNDGDALFPAIAVNPRAAILATLCSAVPAIAVGYGFHFLAPGFMN
ncbi:putative 10TM heavy-metal exporter [Rhodovulum bhavnagarense]|uniref:Putative 10TM heavy-metal exporter n=1 Tax=Rhodovulum bhavnagarense TaxID=992286 RepID=A0A4R2RCT1_9RHOB|nr:putative manganese transporter [Rhodovulum bhavnagarense]TCP60244.1 putative 10TM heavy-metal exporter [Rhodovulum bhavnagarense]